MTSYQIKKLYPEDFNKWSNIGDMEKKPKMAKMFYDELVNGNRITFIYLENNEFIGEGSLVLKKYESNTLRGNLGLPYPENRYSI